ncbi:MAG: hypothetical protein SGJ09_15600 [Phycisphaerae bacterium]|nr:hypothetical protein [Phycisphaerae bacterium]
MRGGSLTRGLRLAGTMPDAPTMPPTVITATSTELLRALNDPGASAWGAFVGRYRPLIECFARRCGIDSETARDIAQSTLLEFHSSYRQGTCSREQGRLRD